MKSLLNALQEGRLIELTVGAVVSTGGGVPAGVTVNCRLLAFTVNAPV